MSEIATALGNNANSLARMIPTTGLSMSPRTTNFEAYDLYLRGIQKLTSTRPAEVEQAAGLFEQALTLDAHYADAWAAKGWSLHILGRPGQGHTAIPASVYPEAMAAYRKALQIDPDHAFSKGRLGVALMVNDFNWNEGMRLIEQSLIANPNDASLLAI